MNEDTEDIKRFGIKTNKDRDIKEFGIGIPIPDFGEPNANAIKEIVDDTIKEIENMPLFQSEKEHESASHPIPIEHRFVPDIPVNIDNDVFERLKILSIHTGIPYDTLVNIILYQVLVTKDIREDIFEKHFITDIKGI